jgi:hypothetical protein
VKTGTAFFSVDISLLRAAGVKNAQVVLLVLVSIFMVMSTNKQSAKEKREVRKTHSVSKQYIIYTGTQELIISPQPSYLIIHTIH